MLRRPLAGDRRPGNTRDAPSKFEPKQEAERDVEEIAVNVLHDQRERTLAQISFTWLADSTGGRIRPERFVIRAAIIIAGKAQAARCPENQQCR